MRLSIRQMALTGTARRADLVSLDPGQPLGEVAELACQLPAEVGEGLHLDAGVQRIGGRVVQALSKRLGDVELRVVPTLRHVWADDQGDRGEGLSKLGRHEDLLGVQARRPDCFLVVVPAEAMARLARGTAAGQPAARQGLGELAVLEEWIGD